MTSEWNHSTINDVCVLVTDGSHSSPKSVNDGKYMVSVKDFTDYGFDFASCRMISNDDYETLKRNGCVPQIDDILIGKDGARFFEDIIIYRQREKPALLSSIAILRCDKSKILPDFLYYVLRTPSFRQDVKDNYGSGSAIPRIILKDFKRMMVSYPSLEKQQAIISVLTAIDSKIQANTEINDNLQRQLRTIFKAEFTDNPELEKMTQIPLSELCHVVTKGTTPTTLGKPFVESGIIFIKAESILADHSLDKSKFAFIDEETNALLKRSVIHAGDIVFTIAGTLGRFALIDDNALPANTNQAVAIIRADAEKVLPEYIYTCFIGEWHTDYYAKRVQQAVQANLSLTTIKSLPIPVLDKAKMDEYLRLILPLIKAIKGNEAQNEKLAALRDALLPKLMSGEIDVSAVQL